MENRMNPNTTEEELQTKFSYKISMHMMYFVDAEHTERYCSKVFYLPADNASALEFLDSLDSVFKNAKRIDVMNLNLLISNYNVVSPMAAHNIKMTIDEITDGAVLKRFREMMENTVCKIKFTVSDHVEVYRINVTGFPGMLNSEIRQRFERYYFNANICKKDCWDRFDRCRCNDYKDPYFDKHGGAPYREQSAVIMPNTYLSDVDELTVPKPMHNVDESSNADAKTAARDDRDYRRQTVGGTTGIPEAHKIEVERVDHAGSKFKPHKLIITPKYNGFVVESVGEMIKQLRPHIQFAIQHLKRGYVVIEDNLTYCDEKTKYDAANAIKEQIADQCLFFEFRQ